MSVIDIRPVPGTNGDIRRAIKIIKESVQVDTMVVCPYIDHIFDPAGNSGTRTRSR